MTKESGSKSQVRIIAVLIVGIAAIVLAFQNREVVQTRVFFWQVSMPRFALLLLTTAFGFLAGFLAGSLRARRA